MKKIFFYFLIAIFVAFNNSIQAQTTQLRGGTCWGAFTSSATLSPNMLFSCQHLGKVTISQIYEKGFRVVSTINHTQDGLLSLIIEEQRN